MRRQMQLLREQLQDQRPITTPTCGAAEPCAAAAVPHGVIDTNEKLLAMKLAKKVRPEKRFSKGDALEFTNTMAKFDLATDSPALDARTKLLELAHYFDGPPAKIITAYIAQEDAAKAYAKARSEIEFLHGCRGDSIVPLLERLSKGKQLPANDVDAHVILYAELRNLHTTASNAGNTADFSRETIRKIVRNRLDHLANSFFTKDQKSVVKHSRHLDFEEMMDFIRNWIAILNSKGAPLNQSTVKVAALENVGDGEKMGPLTFAQKANPTTSPPKQQPTCSVCSNYHPASQCSKLAAMAVDDRAKELMKKGLCFGCLGPGHRQPDCPLPAPVCMQCREPHNSVLHGRKIPAPRQRSRSASTTGARPAAASRAAPASLMSIPAATPSAPTQAPPAGDTL